MNPQPPINQALIGIFQGSAADIAARLTSFTDSRANLRKWHLPPYTRFLEFPAYETQMKAIFHDAFIYDRCPLLVTLKLLLTREVYMMSVIFKHIQLLSGPSPLKIPAFVIPVVLWKMTAMLYGKC